MKKSFVWICITVALVGFLSFGCAKPLTNQPDTQEYERQRALDGAREAHRELKKETR
ncbi:hypothetical protein LGV61_05335 [Desulfurispirillum indicum]|uniref:hypothetical protein n=1 Tax=Desulfurispirillum indicum TaxID=936456 RepID=UPI001CFBA459|nr:hypothetical protein [Desulfurispirillum indicum]UCZ57698.1 hypothetical protein LGV61_05335 [Desulfurispirillum indicum]